MIDVGGHGDDGGDGAGSGEGTAEEDGEEGIADEVAGAADAVEHAGAAEVGGVGVSVEVDFEGGVDGDDAEAADDAGVVGDFLGAEAECAGRRRGGRCRGSGGGRELRVSAVALMAVILPERMASKQASWKTSVYMAKGGMSGWAPRWERTAWATLPRPHWRGRNSRGKRPAARSARRKEATLAAMRWAAGSGAAGGKDFIGLGGFDDADDFFGIDDGVRPADSA